MRGIYLYALTQLILDVVDIEESIIISVIISDDTIVIKEAIREETQQHQGAEITKIS